MRIEIKDICAVIMGVTSSRIERAFFDEHKLTPILFNASLECKSADLSDLKSLQLEDKEINNEYTVSRIGDIIVDLTTFKVLYVNQELSNYIVHQKYAIMRCDADMVNPHFLCWYINVYLENRKNGLLQGSTITNIPISTIRDLIIELPSMKDQITIGNTYYSLRKKIDLEYSKNKFENILIQNQLKNFYESGVK